MKIKEILKKLKNNILLSEILNDVKICVKEDLNMGNIVEVLNKKQEKYSTCPEGYPSEYYSKKNMTEEFLIKTDTEVTLLIVQKYLGINFEAPCDEELFIIYDENKEVLYDSSNKENNKRKVLEDIYKI